MRSFPKFRIQLWQAMVPRANSRRREQKAVGDGKCIQLCGSKLAPPTFAHFTALCTTSQKPNDKRLQFTDDVLSILGLGWGCTCTPQLASFDLPSDTSMHDAARFPPVSTHSQLRYPRLLAVPIASVAFNFRDSRVYHSQTWSAIALWPWLFTTLRECG